MSRILLKILFISVITSIYSCNDDGISDFKHENTSNNLEKPKNNQNTFFLENESQSDNLFISKIEAKNTYIGQNPIVRYNLEGFYDFIDQVSAKFTFSNKIINQGDKIRFTNTSTGEPTSYYWEFEGATPSSSSEKNPEFKVNKFGLLTVKLTTKNAFGPSSISKKIIAMPTEGLILYYPFNGNLNDSSKYNFNGKSNANFTVDRFGNKDKAISFNGIDQYIDLPNDSILKPQFPMSFSYWVKFGELKKCNTTIFTNDFVKDNHAGVWMTGSATGYLSINYGDARGNTTRHNRKTKVGTTKLEKDVWYHVVGIIYEYEAMEIYINGVNDFGEYNGFGESLGYTLNNGCIGRKDSNTNLPEDYFYGKLDDFRYWNKALSQEEIELLYKY